MTLSVKPPRLISLFRTKSKLFAFLFVSFASNALCLNDFPLAFTSDTFQVGVHLSGETYKFSTEFRNVSDRLVEVQKIKPSCLCTTATVSPALILAGAKGKLRLTLKMSYERGSFTERIFLQTSRDEKHILLVKGKIKPRYSCSPVKVDLGEIAWNAEPIVINSKITCADSNDSAARFFLAHEKNWITTTLVKEESGRRNISVKIEKAPIGPFTKLVVVHTKDKRQPQIIFTVQGRVRGPIKVSPERLYFGMVKKGEEISKSLTIEPFGVGKVVIDKIALDGLPVRYSLLALGKNAMKANIVLKMPDREGLFKGLLVIAVSTPRYEKRIPVVAYVK